MKTLVKERSYLMIAVFICILSVLFGNRGWCTENSLDQQVSTDDELLHLARQLVTLRSEVEALNHDLERKKADMKDQLAALTAQKAELESLINNESLKLKQIQQSHQKTRAYIGEHMLASEYLAPLVSEQSGHLAEYVRSSLPFQTGARLSEIEKIETLVSQQKLPYEQAIAQLWSFIEDEFRLSRESGLYRQPVLLENKEIIAEVARLGMVLMYFKTTDGRVGYAVPENGDWNYKLITTRDDRKRVLYLFDSLKKRIREGYYELPNPPSIKG